MFTNILELIRLLPGRPASNLIPPGTHVLPLPDQVLLPGLRHQQVCEPDVAQVRQDEVFSSQVLAL